MYDYNLFADIKKLLIESHTKEEIKNLSTSELKKLHKEYSEKDTDEAKKEADEIKKEIDSRGEDDGEEKAKAAKKPDVAQQNEELLAILDTLCEMVGVDMETLMEQMTRKDFVNWGQAEGWNEPAPAAAPHGSLAANARDILVKAARARGTRSQRLAAAARADAIPAGKETAIQIETEVPPVDISEPSAEKRAAGAPGAVVDRKQFNRSQRSIEGITDDVARVAQHRELINRLKPFTLGGNKPKVNKPKGKGKGKK